MPTNEKVCECGFLFAEGCRQHLEYLHKERSHLLALLRQFHSMEKRMVGVPEPYIKKVNRAIYRATVVS